MDCEYDQSNCTQISTTESCYENFRTRSKNVEKKNTFTSNFLVGKSEETNRTDRLDHGARIDGKRKT